MRRAVATARATERIPRLRRRRRQVLPGLEEALINLAPATPRPWTQRPRSETSLSSLRRPRRGHQTGSVEGGQADVPLEGRFATRRQVHDVQTAQIRTRIRSLNRRITDDRVLSHHRRPCPSHDNDALRIACNEISIDNVASSGANHANAKIVCWIGETIA
jgi:hypothetical protein